ncbi:GNAT family N-acetyltransferase [Dokdonella sp.]|uniref:GNAT family N-acetyltransferase n=1 Tax=Dokdonella sp. TaxID=2291710 RepID=UPI0025BC7161|nr:GNAT family N-acetyltransferase [Dokdonella sp.]MBX3689989.1 GNAT family N-acetyltransferase [Dokdonella sp.]
MRPGAAARTVTLREADSTDIPELVSLVESAYRGETSRRGWTTEADLLDGQRIDAAGMAEVVGKPDSRVVLVVEDGLIVACAHLQRQQDAAYFGMFAVRPDRQGAGLGDTLLRECEHLARDGWMCAILQMTVISVREELIAWYERRGYRRTGRYKPFPYGDARFGAPRRDDLRFEWLEKAL